MAWNWQHKDWPNFIYNPEQFIEDERRFLHNAGVLHGSIKHIAAAEQESLVIELISNEAFKTSEIEGAMLNRDSLQSSIRKQFGLKTDQRRVQPAEHGIAEMMVDLYKNSQRKLKHEHLFSWHQMLTNGRRDIKKIGAYRTHKDPMQVVSGALYDPKIHFEAPPSSRVKKEMDHFIEWFNATGEKSQTTIMIRAGLAHIYFESIHPFEDGNGRIGRALSELALSQGLGHPTLIAISHTIEATKKDYYSALQRNSSHLEMNDWLDYFCETTLSAQARTQTTINFLIEKGKFYLKFSDKLNQRQAKVVERIFREGINGFTGGLSAENYIRITGAARATVTRDLQDMVEQGALLRTGERKSTRYHLNISSLI